MGKISVLLVFFLLIAVNVSADDYSSEAVQHETADRYFINLNPLFFDNAIGFSAPVYGNYHCQYSPTGYEKSQDNNILAGLLIAIPGYSMLWTYAYTNPQAARYLQEAWEKNIEAEKIFSLIRGNAVY